MSQILTVVIPTRDRADTLVHTLKTVTSQTNPDLEIIVSDNFSGPKVKEVVDSVNDKRLRYIRTEQPLGMSEHWDFALAHVKGDWVTFVGDDDGLVPGAVDKFFKVVKENPGIRAITCVNSWYRWPLGSEGAKLSVNGSKGYEVRSCKEYMKKALLGQPVSQPTIYTGGFVKMDLVNEIKSKNANGRFFNSITTDYYSGMAICSVEDKYIYSWDAWCIAGTSKHSTGSQHKSGSAEQRKKMNFYKESSIKFHPSLGDAVDASVGSMQIYLYEAYLQSAPLRNFDLGITLQQQLEIAIAHAGKKIRKDLIEYCRAVADKNGLDFQAILSAANRRRPLYKLRKRLLKLSRSIGFGNIPTKMVKGDDIQNVYEASLKINSYK